MTIARGQMNRQLYQAGSGIGSLDIPMNERILISETLEPESRDYINDELMSAEDREVMERLMELQKNPEYQYDEENMYEGPRDMRMGGGIMTLRQPYGFGSFVSSIAKGITGAVKGVGKAVGSVLDKENLDKIAQVASFIPGPHQPFAAAYTGARGSGIGGDFGGFQIGGFTPSGSMFGVSPTSGPSFASFQPQRGGFPGFPGSGSKEFGIADALRIGSALFPKDPTTPDDNIDTDEEARGGDIVINPDGTVSYPGSGIKFNIGAILDILGLTKKEGLGAAGGAGLAALTYADRKRLIEELERQTKQQRADVSRFREQFTKAAGTGRATGAPRTTADVVKSPVTAAQGGIINSRRGYMMGSEVPMRQNPAGIQELDYRQSGGFVPPIGIKEKADDIPAMLSNNEFVFTADAVRAAGGGSVNKGAQKMYALMKQLEGQA